MVANSRSRRRIGIRLQRNPGVFGFILLLTAYIWIAKWNFNQVMYSFCCINFKYVLPLNEKYVHKGFSFPRIKFSRWHYGVDNASRSVSVLACYLNGIGEISDEVDLTFQWIIQKKCSSNNAYSVMTLSMISLVETILSSMQFLSFVSPQVVFSRLLFRWKSPF